ncbi:hypothetical protein CLIB1423_06S02894 [[Candida] railenensis]|uniref:Uncharacterized protein n=1 Tax=[Candida] railenensis TaxID=45579 RepID=A0A9P0VY74_9ASCO|nr:hypothetical protein CLIB1423_06S02894 [[Candida] railenensis]
MAVLPPFIRSLLKAHSFLSSSLNAPVTSKEAIKAYLQVRNAEFKRRLLLSPNPIVEPGLSVLLKDIPKPFQSHIQSIFEKPIIEKEMELQDILVENTTGEADKGNEGPSDIYCDPSAPIANTKALLRKTGFSTQVFQAVFSNHYPLQPDLDESLHKSSIEWTDRLLKDTPFMFILKQTHRLFSDNSLNQINPSRVQFQNELQKLAAISSKSSKIQRSYYFCSMWNLAVFNRCLGGEDDPMVQELLRERELKVTDEFFEPLSLSEEDLNQLTVNEYPGDRRDIPYDLKYTSFSVATIERKIRKQDHTTFLKLLEEYKDEFEVIGVRFSLNSSWIKKNLQDASILGEEKVQASHGSYDDMLSNIKKVEEPSNFKHLLKGLGELGLTEVKQGKDCLYLVRE